jgi:hypothetical protein
MSWQARHHWLFFLSCVTCITVTQNRVSLQTRVFSPLSLYTRSGTFLVMGGGGSTTVDVFDVARRALYASYSTAATSNGYPRTPYLSLLYALHFLTNVFLLHIGHIHHRYNGMAGTQTVMLMTGGASGQAVPGGATATDSASVFSLLMRTYLVSILVFCFASVLS